MRAAVLLDRARGLIADVAQRGERRLGQAEFGERCHLIETSGVEQQLSPHLEFGSLPSRGQIAREHDQVDGHFSRELFEILEEGVDQNSLVKLAVLVYVKIGKMDDSDTHLFFPWPAR